MPRRYPRPPLENKITPELVNELADWIEARIPDAGEPTITRLADAVYHEIMNRRNQRQVDTTQQEVEAAYQWAKDQGLIFPDAYMKKHGLSKAEMLAAIDAGMLAAHSTPMRSQSIWAKAVPDRALNDAERQQLAQLVTLTANQAAERLGITRAEFDRRKKKAGIQPVSHRKGTSGWPYDLFSQADVDKLKG